MEIKITVKRRRSPGETSYEQSFMYQGDGRLSVADWIREINRTDAADDEIVWECGCLEMKCGACAMLINGYPTLACSLTLKDAAKRGGILLEPLSKFPVIKDLAVDRKVMFDTLKEMKIWLEDKGKIDFAQDRNAQYQASKCLQCGCCLEICPNFISGGRFAGASAMLNAYKAIEQSELGEHRSEMIKEYRKRFFSACGQSLSCNNVCPAGLPLDEIQARANHLRK